MDKEKVRKEVQKEMGRVTRYIEEEVVKPIVPMVPREEVIVDREKWKDRCREFRNNKGVGKGKENLNKSESMARLSYLVKLGWMNGKTTTDTMDECGYDYRRGKSEALETIKAAIRAEAAELNADEIYMEFWERTKGIIGHLEALSTRIENSWAREDKMAESDPGYIPKYANTREYIVLWDMVMKWETKRLEIGMEMGIYGKHGDDKQFILEGVSDLLPTQRQDVGMKMLEKVEANKTDKPAKTEEQIKKEREEKAEYFRNLNIQKSQKSRIGVSFED